MSFFEERWNKLDTVNHLYGMRFDNLIKEDKSLNLLLQYKAKTKVEIPIQKVNGKGA